jgi:hypothetical protein
VNETTLALPWDGELERGPVGEYLEVIDIDPASGRLYDPVDLNDPMLLAQDGWPPSEGNPGFHQQMVYAVGMTTIGHFEKALGRKALWAPRYAPADRRQAEGVRGSAAQIYPHAPRQRLLQPREEGASVRLFPRRLGRRRRDLAGLDGLHMPVERHHRPRDVPRAARRPPPPLPGGLQPRRPGLP